MSRSFLAELPVAVPVADTGTVTGTSEVALWTVATYTPTLASGVRAGQVFRLYASGKMTSAGSSPGTLTITPRFGTTTGGTTLGASAASPTLTVSQTDVAWVLDACLVIRTIGATGTAILGGRFQCNAVGINALNFGGAQATVDTTAAAGLFIGVTLGSASDSMTPQIVVWESKN